MLFIAVMLMLKPERIFAIDSGTEKHSTGLAIEKNIALTDVIKGAFSTG